LMHKLYCSKVVFVDPLCLDYCSGAAWCKIYTTHLPELVIGYVHSCKKKRLEKVDFVVQNLNLSPVSKGGCLK
ncbi:MAG: hypothetical protein MJA31_17020, partial [Clostridia bacterium]|nr:hypothetical protein [Clostridia bacterium]